jgi:hypothetical protein
MALSCRSVPSAGRLRQTSGPDPTDTSLLALAPPVINYPIPFILSFHPIFIYIYRSHLMKLTPWLLLYIYYLNAPAPAPGDQGM